MNTFVIENIGYSDLDLGVDSEISLLEFRNSFEILGTIGPDDLDLSGILEIAGSFPSRITVNLRPGDDIYIGSQISDDIDGGTGNDSIIGGLGNDTIFGNVGMDTLSGGPGNDLIFARSDASEIEVFNGGDGVDTVRPNVIFSQFTSLILDSDASVEVLNLDNRGITGTSLDDIFDFTGLISIEPIRTAIDGMDLLPGNDTFRGSEEPDNVIGGIGSDTLIGNGGNDTLLGGVGDDVIYGGDGNDVLGASGELERFTDISSGDQIFGGNGFDELNLFFGDSFVRLTLDAEASIETIRFPINIISGSPQPLRGSFQDDLIDITGVSSFTNNDRVILLEGNDVFLGSSVGEDIDAGDGNDTINSGGGNDTIEGGPGNDIVSGGGGIDTFLVSGELQLTSIENDNGILVIEGRDGRDAIDADIEFIDFSFEENPYSFSELLLIGDLRSEPVTVVIDAGGQFDFAGGEFDRAVASEDAGRVRIFGDERDQEIIGNSNSNVLVSGGGEDVMTGGGGGDFFAVERTDPLPDVTITDFDAQDNIALDDQFFGLSDANVNLRQVTPDEILLALRAGFLGYDFETNELSVPSNGPGSDLEVIITFSSIPPIGLDDLFIF